MLTGITGEGTPVNNKCYLWVTTNAKNEDASKKYQMVMKTLCPILGPK
jgi:hypothetical protein